MACLAIRQYRTLIWLRTEFANVSQLLCLQNGYIHASMIPKQVSQKEMCWTWNKYIMLLEMCKNVWEKAISGSSLSVRELLFM